MCFISSLCGERIKVRVLRPRCSRLPPRPRARPGTGHCPRCSLQVAPAASPAAPCPPWDRHCPRRLMGCSACARLAPALLIHVNLLLCVAAGGALATAARLKWDPSTYVALRELFPQEYRVAGVVLCAAGAALLALAHLAAAALAARAARPRLARALLLTYAVTMTVLACAETAWGAWTGARLACWLRSERAARLLDLLELRDHLRPLLVFLARYHPLPDHLNDLMEEAEADAPRNVFACAAAVLLTALLQPAAALLALLCVPPRAAPHPRSYERDSIGCSVASTDSEKAPLKTAFRNGRLVIL